MLTSSSPVLGLSAFYHDSAAALVAGGSIVAAAQEERFTRIKHDAGFPANALRYCLDEAGLEARDLAAVVFYDKPFLKFERLVETYLAFAPKGFLSFRTAIPIWIRDKLFQKRLLIEHLRSIDPKVDWGKKLLFAEHHHSHAASAFYASPFDEAIVLTMDGVGEWTTTSVAVGRGRSLEIVRELHFPHSLGLLYSAFTYYTGFKVNSGEYKVMGLAPYGVPRFKDLILEKLVDLKPDGSFRLDLRYFSYCTGLTMTSDRFHMLFGGPPRRPESALEQRHMDLAASIQAATEEIVLRITRSLADEFACENLCLAGGVALNCVANGAVLRDGRFKRIWIQPAAGDSGGALGAAFIGYHSHLGHPRQPEPKGADAMQGSYLGPAFEQADVERRLTAIGGSFKVHTEGEVLAITASALAEGQAVGWFQGRMEYGPRALGARSILGDPRSPTMQRDLNLKVKYRESFRPFAPSVLRGDIGTWFEMDCDSPYMLLVGQVSPERTIPMTASHSQLFGIEKLNVVRSQIPAVTHVDYSARIQTVHRETNLRYHLLLERFKELTGCPVLINTSFNVRGEPIVCTPEDAFRCFMGTELDLLVIENCVLRKSDQDVHLRREYKDRFDLD